MITINNKFTVLVLATMSAGKSTFINALIGQELLHSANEATTACLTSVFHSPDLKDYYGEAYNVKDEKIFSETQVTKCVLRKWNADPEVARICIAGAFNTSPLLQRNLVIHDTPGPNNSQDSQHAEQMFDAVRNIPFDVTCYLLNATQLGTSDDQSLLLQLRQELQQKGKTELPIFFILNKVDQIDSEKNESVSDFLQNTSHYLTKLGYKDPIIIPAESNNALFALKELNAEKLTRSQRHALQQAVEETDAKEMELVSASLVPQEVKTKLIEKLWVLANEQRHKDIESEGYKIDTLQRLSTISGVKTFNYLLEWHYSVLLEKQKSKVSVGPHLIEITHNPFTVETDFLINGHTINKDSMLFIYKETRLQFWIEWLFDDLAELFNSENNYKITFKGIKSDYLDMVEAAQVAVDEGIQVEIKWKPVMFSEQDLDKAKQLPLKRKGIELLILTLREIMKSRV